MSVPTEVDFVLIKIGDGASPEVFSAVCGIQDATITRTVNTADRYVRDCAKPGEVPTRRIKVLGKSLDITGGGLTDKTGIGTLDAALGHKKNIKAECYSDDGTDAGALLGTFALNMALTEANLTVPRDGDGSGTVALKSNGAWTWTAAS